MNNAIEELTIETNTVERSGLATASLICSLIICCPITTIVGPILGIVSLATLKGRSGKVFAWTAIIVGLISTIFWVIAGVFIGNMSVHFIKQTGEVTTTTITAGYDGNYATFREGLARGSISVSDEEIASFITELQSRYGTFDSAILNMESQEQTITPSTGEAPFPMILVFETSDVKADVVMEIIPVSSFEFDIKIGCFRIVDSKNGDLIFPKGSSCDTKN
jgi:hypothetical protein